MSTTSVKLSSKLPEHANGLDAIYSRLLDRPTEKVVVVAEIDVKSVVRDLDTGDIVPTARLLAVEPLTTETAAATARELLKDAYTDRTGADTLPYEGPTRGEITAQILALADRHGISEEDVDDRVAAYFHDQLTLVGADQLQLREFRAYLAEQLGETVVADGPADDVEPESGVCRECGCTDDKACDDGCSWADEAETLCTACVPADETAATVTA